jgi:hypothetical protein
VSSENGVAAEPYAASSDPGSSTLIFLRGRPRGRAGGTDGSGLESDSFVFMPPLAAKTEGEGETGGGMGGGSKDSSYASSEIGFPAFFAAAFLFKNQRFILKGSTSLSADHLRRELAEGTRESEDQREKSSEITCSGIAGVGVVTLLGLDFALDPLDCSCLGVFAD